MEKKYIDLKWDTEKMEKFFSILICAIAFIQFCFVVFVNYTKAPQVLNWDSAIQIRHEIEMWRSHSLFLQGFKYGSTLEIDTPAFLFLPIYLLTNNLGLALAIGYALYYIGELFLCMDLFNNIGKGRAAGVLATVLLFTPYAVGELDWDNMLFYVGGQYSFRVLSLIFMLEIILLWEKEGCLKKKIVITCLGALEIFWTSLSSGSYILLVEVFPILAWLIFKGIKKDSFRIQLGQLLSIIGIIFACLLGWGIHNTNVGNLLTSNNNVITASEFFPNLGNGITGFFMLFGGMNDNVVYAIFSKNGILMLLRCVFPVAAIILILIRIICKKNLTELEFIGLLVVAVNMVIIVFTHTRYGASIFEYRYHIIWAAIMLICVAELWSEFKNMRYHLLFVLGTLVSILILNAGGFRDIMYGADSTQFAKEVVEVSDELDCDTIICYNNQLLSRIIRCIDADKYCVYMTYEDGTASASTYHWYYDYSDASNECARNILIINQSDLESFPSQVPNNYSYVMTVSGEYDIYISETNPWDGVSGLPHEEISIDYPYSAGYTYVGELYNGVLGLKESEESYLIGPETEAISGTYNIALSYTDSDLEDPGAYITVLVDDNEIYQEISYGADGTILFENITVPEGSEFSISLYSVHGNWSLKSITYSLAE